MFCIQVQPKTLLIELNSIEKDIKKALRKIYGMRSQAPKCPADIRIKGYFSFDDLGTSFFRNAMILMRKNHGPNHLFTRIISLAIIVSIAFSNMKFERKCFGGFHNV